MQVSSNMFLKQRRSRYAAQNISMNLMNIQSCSPSRKVAQSCAELTLAEDFMDAIAWGMLGYNIHKNNN